MEKKKINRLAVIAALLICFLPSWGNAEINARGNEKARPYALKAAHYMQDGNFQEAIKEFKKAVKLDRTFFTAHHGLASCYMILGQYNKSIRASQNGIKNCPEIA